MIPLKCDWASGILSYQRLKTAGTTLNKTISVKLMLYWPEVSSTKTVVSHAAKMYNDCDSTSHLVVQLKIFLFHVLLKSIENLIEFIGCWNSNWFLTFMICGLSFIKQASGPSVAYQGDDHAVIDTAYQSKITRKCSAVHLKIKNYKCAWGTDTTTKC